MLPRSNRRTIAAPARRGRAGGRCWRAQRLALAAVGASGAAFVAAESAPGGSREPLAAGRELQGACVPRPQLRCRRLVFRPGSSPPIRSAPPGSLPGCVAGASVSAGGSPARRAPSGSGATAPRSTATPGAAPTGSGSSGPSSSWTSSMSRTSPVRGTSKPTAARSCSNERSRLPVASYAQSARLGPTGGRSKPSSSRSASVTAPGAASATPRPTCSLPEAATRTPHNKEHQ
jgi:hypothetical protein